MKTYREWIEERRVSVKEEIEYYSRIYENKEVRVHSVGSRIFINWYIDNKVVKAIFPKEIEKEIIDYIEGLYCKYISKDLLNNVVNKMSKYLPYLTDDNKDENESLKYVQIKGEIKL